MWPMMIASLAGAGLGMMNAQQQRAQKKEEMLANAEQIKMSPWTGAKAQVEGYGQTPSSAMGALQGGLTGAMMGSQFGKASAAAPAAEAAAPSTGSALGGQQMSAQLGDQANQFTAQNSAWASPQMKQPSFWSNQYAMNRGY